MREATPPASRQVSRPEPRDVTRNNKENPVLYVRYLIIRSFTLLPPVRERQLRSELRRLNLATEAVRFARSYPIHT